MYFSVEIFRCLDSGQAGNVERMRYCRVSLSVHCPQGDNVTQVSPPSISRGGLHKSSLQHFYLKVLKQQLFMLTWAPFNNNNNSTTYTRKEASKLTNEEKEERKLKLMSQLSLWATRWHTSFVNFLSTYAIFD